MTFNPSSNESFLNKLSGKEGQMLLSRKRGKEGKAGKEGGRYKSQLCENSISVLLAF